jgi:acyl-coenzyme A synthetase/AMP-(fatty) acid ligase
MNAAELLLSTGMDETVALICGDSAMTYAQLRERVTRVAGWLLAQGLRSGDRVIVIGSDGNAWVIVWLATVWAGGVAVGLNPRRRSEELGAVLNEVAPCLCFADAEPATCISSISLYASVKLVALEGVDGLAAERVLPAAWRPEDPAFWIYSSGTTGRPKAVVHAHRAVDACAAFAREVLAATAQDRFYATSRLFFAYALANSLFAALRLGATVILDPGWPTPEKSVDLLRRHRPTLLFSVPTFYHQLLTCGAAASWIDSSAEVMPGGSSPAGRTTW